MNYTTTEKELLAIVFALDKFRSYMLSSKVIVFFDYVALKFLLKKLDTKPRLIRQERCRDKKGAETLVIDHLSQIEREINPMPIRDDFPDEQLLQIDKSRPWYADICNFLVTSIFPPGASRTDRKKLESEAKYYVWDDPYLWRFCNNQIIRSRSSTSTIQQPKAAITDQLGLLGRYLNASSISPQFSEMLTNSSRPANDSSTRGVLISWDYSQSPIETLIFSLLLTTSRDRWKLRPPGQTMRKLLFGVSKVLISDQESHFCNKTMLTLLEKYG
ncbi:hypothetical protein CR513_22642, partial [Mucuna pruriens]